MSPAGERAPGSSTRSTGAHRFKANQKSSTFTVPSTHFDVRRFQIAVDDALLVRRFERLRNLPRNREGFVDREPSRSLMANG